MFTFRIFGCKGESEAEKPAYLTPAKRHFRGLWVPRRGLVSIVCGAHLRRRRQDQTRRVRVNCWLVELVQFSWLAEISRQLKLIGDWRISEVPLIWTELAPVMT